MYLIHLFALLFTRHLPDINVTLEAMLQPKATSLPGHIQAVYVQSIAKLYAKILANQQEEVGVKCEAHNTVSGPSISPLLSHFHEPGTMQIDQL